MANDVSPIYVGQRRPVQQWTWTRGDGTHPDLVTGSPTLSVEFIPFPISAESATVAGTGVFSGQTTYGVFNYALSAADVAAPFSGAIRFKLTYSDGTFEKGDPIAFVILP
jgi:hypothetical protein